MTERFYYEHFHCYQYNILDKQKQDEDGDDWIIGTANGETDAKNICKELNEQDNTIKQLKQNVERLSNINKAKREQIKFHVDGYNQLKQEKESWKQNCLDTSNENSILWNEISIMRQQGAKTSDAFEEYLDKISTKYTRFWKRKLNKAKENGVLNDRKTI